MTFSCKRSNTGFTLIELLVVITIIGLLAGLAFPAISGALKAAKKAEASAMVNQLRVSLTAYQTEYGNWPTGIFANETTPVESDDSNLYDLLRGKDTPAGENPRLIVFMEFNAKILRAGALAQANSYPPANSSTATAFVDPWSQPYYFVADVDYNNEIAVPADTTGDEVINAALGIWSKGPQATWDGTADPKKNYLRSWK
jgi:prepilin-type N-terminal cleavage/methylation domain-containing protein